MNSNIWNSRFVQLCTDIESWSKDSTKVAAIIVNDDHDILSIGYNGFPRGMDDNIQERHERPLKYSYTEHAERNAIYNAARKGVSILGTSMYLKWYPCVDCARAIVQSGIKNLYCSKPDFKDIRWGEDFKISQVILTECGVNVNYL